MFHACVEKFDVMGTVEKILGTKRASVSLGYSGSTGYLVGHLTMNSMTDLALGGLNIFQYCLVFLLRDDLLKG